MAKSKSIWFTSVRGSYLPATGTGFIIYLTYTAYVVALAADWWHNGHHGWFFLVDVLPLSVAAAVLTQYIASRHAK